MKLVVDTAQIDGIANNAGKITLSPDAEVGLLTLIEMRDKIDQAIAYAEEVIDARASKIDPAWSAIQSDNIKITKSPTGPRYVITDNKISEEFLKIVKRTMLDPSKVDEYIEATDKLPVGVGLNERKYKVKIKPRYED